MDIEGNRLRQHITPEQRRERRLRQEQCRVQNMTQTEFNARLERRRTTQRLRRSLLPPTHMRSLQLQRSTQRIQQQRATQLATRRTPQPTHQTSSTTTENVVLPTTNQGTQYLTVGTLTQDDPNAKQFLYRDIPSHYRWCSKDKLWIRRQSGQRVVGRIYTVSPSEGERFYLRILLNHIKGVTSFDDLLTIDGHQSSTFKQAAELHGLLEHDDSIRQCFLEAANFHMPSTLRRLFASILVYCEPVGVRSLWDEIYPYMSEDYVTSMGSNDGRVLNKVLRDLNNVLQQNGTSISSFDLPHLTMVIDDSSSVPNIIQDERSLTISEEDLNSIASFNNDQHMVFNTIMNVVRDNGNAIFFVDGPGGTGKTYLYRALLATIRNEGGMAIATTTSGIAATLLPGGRTSHSRFKIPLNLQPSSTCSISKQTDLAKLIREAKIRIWDEAPMTNRYAFEAVIRTLIDILGVNLPFGGKIIVFGGDFRQVLPVIPKGTRAETFNASIVKSPLWEYVKVLHLKENMRSCNDHEFAKFLLRVGNGQEPKIDDDLIKIPNLMAISWEGPQSIDTLIDYVYSNLSNHTNDARYMVGRGVITPLNDDVNKINERVIMRFNGQERIYHSFDRVEDDTHNSYQQEFLNSISLGGMPPHVLRLKVGAPIMLLRNLDPTNGLCNGTRLICRSLNRSFIDAEILDGPYNGTRVFLHRIPLKPPETMQLSFNMIRVQFPIRLSFALTINKSQGQTIPHVGIYLPDHVFSHGQLYVALSRGVSQQTTKVLVANIPSRSNVEVRTRSISDYDLLQMWDKKIEDEFFYRQTNARNKCDYENTVKNFIFSPGWAFSFEVDNNFLRDIIVKELISQLEDSHDYKVHRSRRKKVNADKEMRLFYRVRTRRRCRTYRNTAESLNRTILYPNTNCDGKSSQI